MTHLSDHDVDAAAASLDGWHRLSGALRRSVKFDSFLDGIAAVQRVAEIAERADHHPDIDIRWRTVTFVLVTHSEGGITEKDLQLAREIDEVIGDLLPNH
ncbi:MAG: 4a-hydroxytetrahydrobiopterin dehydratase [Mycobacterium sp.]|nr:4a-hydroxytetrahydrobiopterin dehydratase [Mycobacterium sp.]